MTTIELLQQIGLNKYEAEAYATLLSQGPLTGYELGKRSQVPLSRSYEILERLTQKGLALIQPGDPPRYAAQEPRQFLEETRSDMTALLDALASALVALPHPDISSEFWVLRGRPHILARVQRLIEQAQQTIFLTALDERSAGFGQALALACSRGCSVLRSAVALTGTVGSEPILLLVDGRMALVGTLAPADRCQAVVSAHLALVAVLKNYFFRQGPATSLAHATTAPADRDNALLDWMAWEDRKQQRLWRLSRRIA